MIVQALVGYYEAKAARGEIARFGWEPKNIAFALELSKEGELLAVTPQFVEEVRNKKTVEVPLELTVPKQVVRSSGIRSNFLCDNSAYLLGWDEKGKPERTLNCFLACKERHLCILDGIEGGVAAAVRAFFERWDPLVAESHPILGPELAGLKGANMVFRVEGVLAHEDAAIQAAWDEVSAGEDDEPGEQIRCAVTGKKAPFERVHPKIKLPAAQSTGASLISFNSLSYESYALEGGYNSAVGKYAAFAYTTALNHLISDRVYRKMLGDDTLLYWSEDGASEYQDALNRMLFPEPDESELLDAVMNRLVRGENISDSVNMEMPFYILCLSPNAGRISVRSFHRDRFGSLMENVRRHHKRLEIVKPPQAHKYLSTYWLLQETVNQKSSDKKPAPLLGGAVLNSIRANAPYPNALYQSILIRIRADQTVNWRRAAIIKACLLRSDYVKEEDLTVSYNPDFNHPAYVLGALFSVLEQLQENANNSSTIKERYFSSAGTTPANVFPILIRLSGHHLAKLDTEGQKIFFSKEIGTLLDKIQPVNGRAYPTHLNQNDQGLFHLGYYHKNQARYTGKQKEEV